MQEVERVGAGWEMGQEEVRMGRRWAVVILFVYFGGSSAPRQVPVEGRGWWEGTYVAVMAESRDSPSCPLLGLDCSKVDHLWMLGRGMAGAAQRKGGVAWSREVVEGAAIITSSS